jgi:hypothetical protein
MVDFHHPLQRRIKNLVIKLVNTAGRHACDARCLLQTCPGLTESSDGAANIR